MEGISSTRLPNNVPNRKKYNGIEEARELDLNQYEAFYRTLDPQLGRFWEVDPKTEILNNYSPYESMGNNPINNADPLGDFKTWFGAFFHKVFHGGGKIGQNKFGEYFVRKVTSSVSENGTVIVVANVNYGFGRNKYSSAIENLISDERAVADFTAMGIWDPNLDESQAGKRTLGLGLNFTIPNPFLKSGTNLVNSAKPFIIPDAGKEAPSIIELTEKIIKGFTRHGIQQAINRGFKPEDILKIVREGTPVQAMGRYGPQTKYTLGANSVVVNANGEIVTVYSTAAGTAKGLGQGNFIPFE